MAKLFTSEQKSELDDLWREYLSVTDGYNLGITECTHEKLEKAENAFYDRVYEILGRDLTDKEMWNLFPSDDD